MRLPAKPEELCVKTDVVERIAELANNDSWLVHRGRTLDTTFLLGIGDTDYLVRIHRGRVEAVAKGPFIQPRWTFALRASQDAWNTFWLPVPPPGGHDLFAMIKNRTLRLEGDQYSFMSNLHYFKDLLALPRGAAAGGAR
jgi:hypothetical protein